MAQKTRMSPFFQNILRVVIGLAIIGSIAVMLFPNYFKKRAYYPRNEAFRQNSNQSDNPSISQDENTNKQPNAGYNSLAKFLPAHQPNDPMLIQHKYFTLLYNEKHEQAAWVVHRLEPFQTKGNTPRNEDFRPDRAIPSGSATPFDYRGSGLSRGHLAPAGDFKFSREAMDETFLMSNMSPQDRDFNAGIWNDLEKLVRYWVNRDKVLYVITGPILKDNLPKIGKENRITVPAYYFKIILDYQEPEIKAIAFLMKNEDSLELVENFIVSIDELEELTGYDFFPQLPDDEESRLENMKDKNIWFKGKKWVRR
jgi:endonuclease G